MNYMYHEVYMYHELYMHHGLYVYHELYMYHELSFWKVEGSCCCIVLKSVHRKITLIAKAKGPLTFVLLEQRNLLLSVMQWNWDIPLYDWRVHS